MSLLEIRNLHVSIEGKEILKGLDLTVEQGKVHAIMGPNGTGKSTLAYTLMGHPSYTVTEGEVISRDKMSWSWSRTSAPGSGSFWRSSTRLPSLASPWQISSERRSTPAGGQPIPRIRGCPFPSSASS